MTSKRPGGSSGADGGTGGVSARPTMPVHPQPPIESRAWEETGLGGMSWSKPILVQFRPTALAADKVRSARWRIALRSSCGSASATPALKVYGTSAELLLG